MKNHGDLATSDKRPFQFMKVNEKRRYSQTMKGDIYKYVQQRGRKMANERQTH